MKTLVFVVLLAAVGFAAAGDLKELFTLDCSGNFYMTPNNELLRMQFKAPPLLQNGVAVFYEEMTARIKCTCPHIDQATLDRLFLPTIEGTLNLFSSNPDLSSPNCDLMQFKDSAFDLYFKIVADQVQPLTDFKFALPSTCSYDTWKTTGKCAMEISVSQIPATVQLMIALCPGSYIPFVSATCRGNGCSKLFMPCNSGADCGEALGCTRLVDSSIQSVPTYDQINSALRSMFIYDPSTTRCLDEQTLLTSFLSTVRSFFDGGAYESRSTLQVCLPTAFSNIQPTTDTLTNTFKLEDGCTQVMENRSTTYQQECWNGTQFVDCSQTYWELHTVAADCVTPAGAWLKPWNGLLSDNTMADSALRRSGLLAKPIPPIIPLQAGAEILLAMDCTDNFYFLPNSPSYALSFSVGALDDGVNWFSNTLQKAIECVAPSMSHREFRVRFGAALDAYLYALTTPVEPIAFTTSKVKDWFITLTGARPQMPATCTYDRWISTGMCAAKFTGFADYLGADINLFLRVKSCPNRPQVPSIYVDCVGAACSLISRAYQPCSANSDCASGLYCNSLDQFAAAVSGNANPFGTLGTDIDFIGHLFYPKIYANDTGAYIDSNPTCVTAEKGKATLMNLISKSMGYSGPGNGMFCIPDGAHMKQASSTWVQGQSSTSGTTIVLTNLVSWDAAPLFDFFPTSPTPSSATGLFASLAAVLALVAAVLAF